TRVQDLLREVRRQLRPLERQADAARRHGDLFAELTALRLYLAGRELASLRNRLSTTIARRTELAAEESGLKSSLAQLDGAVLARSEADLAAERDRFETRWAEGVTPPSSRAAEVRGELAALRSGVERGGGEIARVRQRLDVLEQKAARLHDESTRLRDE